MPDTKPRILPRVEGVRNPSPYAIGDALMAEMRGQGLTIKCLSKVVEDVTGNALKYPRLLSIMHGTATVYLHELTTICNVLAIRIEDLVATAAKSTK